MKKTIPATASLGLACLLAGGCATITPGTFKGTANAYNVAMQESAEEQLLLNIVRLRYRDTPYFFEASTVTSQLDLSTSAGIGATFPLDSDATNVLRGDTGISFSERPTISYTPLQGTEFFTRLLERIPFANLALLADSGWSLDTVLRMSLQRANGVTNAAGASGPTPNTAPDVSRFRELASLLFDLQRMNEIHLLEVRDGDETYAGVQFPESGSSQTADRVRELLSLEPSESVYRVRPGAGSAAGGDVIEYNARSVLGVLFYLSQGVKVPAEHEKAGIVTVTRTNNGEAFDWNKVLDGLFEVKTSESRPSGAATAVYYRDNWFYISDSDLASKDTLILLSQMFALQTGDAQGQIPVLTIPVAN